MATIEAQCVSYWGGTRYKGTIKLWPDLKPDQAFEKFLNNYKERSGDKWTSQIEHYWNHYKSMYGESKLSKRQQTK